MSYFDFSCGRCITWYVVFKNVLYLLYYVIDFRVSCSAPICQVRNIQIRPNSVETAVSRLGRSGSTVGYKNEILSVMYSHVAVV